MVKDGERDADLCHCETIVISHKSQKGIVNNESVEREHSRPHDHTTRLRDHQDVETEQRSSQAHSQAFARGSIQAVPFG